MNPVGDGRCIREAEERSLGSVERRAGSQAEMAATVLAPIPAQRENTHRCGRSSRAARLVGEQGRGNVPASQLACTSVSAVSASSLTARYRSKKGLLRRLPRSTLHAWLRRGGEHMSTGTHWALKAIKKAEVIRQAQVEHMISEKEVLASLDHPFVVKERQGLYP